MLSALTGSLPRSSRILDLLSRIHYRISYSGVSTILNEMKSGCFVRFFRVPSACSHGGLLDEGWIYFELMTGSQGKAQCRTRGVQQQKDQQQSNEKCNCLCFSTDPTLASRFASKS